MEMTTETAALMAQVIPALLIVVALEPRFRGEGMEARNNLGRWMMRTGRESAAVAGVISLALCLQVIFADAPNIYASWAVIVSTTWLVLVLLGLFGVMFVAEDERHDTQETGRNEVS